jgi:hypothetical protein
MKNILFIIALAGMLLSAQLGFSALVNLETPAASNTPSGTAAVEKAVTDERNKLAPDNNRGADIGGITKKEHDAITDKIVSIKGWEDQYTRDTRIGENGEVIKIQAIPELYNPAQNRPAKGHYGIRGIIDEKTGKNVVFIYIDSEDYSEARVEHEIAEYNKTAKIAMERNPILTPYTAKVAFVGWLNDPANANEAAKVILDIHKAVVAELGPVEAEIMTDWLENMRTHHRYVYVRGATTGPITHEIFYDVSEQSMALLNTGTVTQEVAEVFNQVFAIDGSKIEGKEDAFKQYLANKAANEAVVAVFKSQGDLDRIAGGFLTKTGLDLSELVHIRVLGQGDLENIREEQLMAMFNPNLARGDFFEVKIGAALDDHKAVVVAIGKGI